VTTTRDALRVEVDVGNLIRACLMSGECLRAVIGEVLAEAGTQSQRKHRCRHHIEQCLWALALLRREASLVGGAASLRLHREAALLGRASDARTSGGAQSGVPDEQGAAAPRELGPRRDRVDRAYPRLRRKRGALESLDPGPVCRYKRAVCMQWACTAPAHPTRPPGCSP
jgi:hypothetical protein